LASSKTIIGFGKPNQQINLQSGASDRHSGSVFVAFGRIAGGDSADESCGSAFEPSEWRVQP
jgi:hypothetical protein